MHMSLFWNLFLCSFASPNISLPPCVCVISPIHVLIIALGAPDKSKQNPQSCPQFLNKKWNPIVNICPSPDIPLHAWLLTHRGEPSGVSDKAPPGLVESTCSTLCAGVTDVSDGVPIGPLLSTALCSWVHTGSDKHCVLQLIQGW